MLVAIIRMFNLHTVGISNAATDSVDEDVYTVTLKSLMSYYEDYSFDQLPYHYVRSYTQ